MPGALVRRSFHSSRNSLSTLVPVAVPQSLHAWRGAISAILSKFRKTRLSPLMCALNTSQLLMPDCRGTPV